MLSDTTQTVSEDKRVCVGVLEVSLLRFGGTAWGGLDYRLSPRWSVRADFEYQYCNRTALCVLGRSAEQVFGRGLLDLYPSHATNGLFDAYVRVMESEVPFTGKPVGKQA